jgi:hypothetical protein
MFAVKHCSATTEARAWLKNSMQEQYNNNTFKKSDNLHHLSLHVRIGAGCFLVSNPSTIHQSLNCIEMSTECSISIYIAVDECSLCF